MNRGEGRGGGNQRNRPYDNTLLNDLHEIIPEALYDSDLFNAPLLRFFQQRIGHMFPAYHRERGFYLRDQADSRRHAFRSTRLSRMPNPVVTSSPPRESVVQTYDASTFNDTFLRSLLLSIVAENAGQSATLASTTAPAPAEETSASAEEEEASSPPPRSQRNIHRFVRTERAGITVTIPGGATTWWDPVSVRPSSATYSRNTVLVDASGVPAGTVCTICQSAPGDDLSGATVLDTMWRKLRGCQHFFHKRCADIWFQNHIQCPNCRADIRTAQPSLPSSTEEGSTLDM
jgi:Ring finger domain